MRGVPKNAIAAVCLAIGLGACADYGFPTTAEAICGVSGFGCHQECTTTPAPAEGDNSEALTYQVGPTSCPSRYVDDARRQARQACRDRGLTLSSAAPQVTDKPAVGPLPPVRSVTFVCGT